MQYVKTTNQLEMGGFFAIRPPRLGSEDFIALTLAHKYFMGVAVLIEI